MGQIFSFRTYLSLLPITAGVMIASGSDLEFNIVGLIAALVSTLAQTGMNLTIKWARMKSGLSGAQSFFGMSLLCSVLSLPLLVARSLHTPSLTGRTWNIMISEIQAGSYFPLFLTGMTSFGYYAEYLLTFIFVGLVSATAFSITDIARRILIIVVGSLVFRKRVVMRQWMGIGIALSGVLWYSLIDSAQHSLQSNNQTYNDELSINNKYSPNMRLPIRGTKTSR
jgi:solute carrier family 35 protein E1